MKENLGWIPPVSAISNDFEVGEKRSSLPAFEKGTWCDRTPTRCPNASSNTASNFG
ncbi:hypothetical protein Pme01_52920 [Planosporangium mesophilum]|uniref:Uncharacterized protein n=2 Tax=Planosporangium mesophilum TaxID=689768 RepID=A0A8J3TQX1_9ACTN|nr:hypothetical protein Pme01_52920 [Planosporangium mesophilum]